MLAVRNLMCEPFREKPSPTRGRVLPRPLSRARSAGGEHHHRLPGDRVGAGAVPGPASGSTRGGGASALNHPVGSLLRLSGGAGTCGVEFQGPPRAAAVIVTITTAVTTVTDTRAGRGASSRELCEGWGACDPAILRRCCRRSRSAKGRVNWGLKGLPKT